MIISEYCYILVGVIFVVCGVKFYMVIVMFIMYDSNLRRMIKFDVFFLWIVEEFDFGIRVGLLVGEGVIWVWVWLLGWELLWLLLLLRGLLCLLLLWGLLCLLLLWLLG